MKSGHSLVISAILFAALCGAAISCSSKPGSQQAVQQPTQQSSQQTADELYQQAMQTLQRGSRSWAKSIFQEIIAKFPGSIQATDAKAQIAKIDALQEEQAEAQRKTNYASQVDEQQLEKEEMVDPIFHGLKLGVALNAQLPKCETRIDGGVEFVLGSGLCYLDTSFGGGAGNGNHVDIRRGGERAKELPACWGSNECVFRRSIIVRVYPAKDRERGIIEGIDSSYPPERLDELRYKLNAAYGLPNTSTGLRQHYSTSWGLVELVDWHYSVSLGAQTAWEVARIDEVVRKEMAKVNCQSFWGNKNAETRAQYALNVAHMFSSGGSNIYTSTGGEESNIYMLISPPEDASTLRQLASAMLSDISVRSTLCAEGFNEVQFIIRDRNYHQQLLTKIKTDVAETNRYILAHPELR